MLILILLVILLCPSLAFAHPGHSGHDTGTMGPGSAVALVGVTLGLAVHAWKTWGAKRPVLAMAGNDGGEPKPEQYTEKQLTWERDNLKPYYTLHVPYVGFEHATMWHPTEPDGPFKVLSRGNFKTQDAACAWALEHLNGTSYSVVLVTFDQAIGGDRLETVYTFEGVRS
jgi:hypothetical protein